MCVMRIDVSWRYPCNGLAYNAQLVFVRAGVAIPMTQWQRCTVVMLRSRSTLSFRRGKSIPGVCGFRVPPRRHSIRLATSLYSEEGASISDCEEAVATLDDGFGSRRVCGANHPTFSKAPIALESAREALARARAARARQRATQREEMGVTSTMRPSGSRRQYRATGPTRQRTSDSSASATSTRTSASGGASGSLKNERHEHAICRPRPPRTAKGATGSRPRHATPASARPSPTTASSRSSSDSLRAAAASIFSAAINEPVAVNN